MGKNLLCLIHSGNDSNKISVQIKDALAGGYAVEIMQKNPSARKIIQRAIDSWKAGMFPRVYKDNVAEMRALRELSETGILSPRKEETSSPTQSYEFSHFLDRKKFYGFLEEEGFELPDGKKV